MRSCHRDSRSYHTQTSTSSLLDSGLLHLSSLPSSSSRLLRRASLSSGYLRRAEECLRLSAGCFALLRLCRTDFQQRDGNNTWCSSRDRSSIRVSGLRHTLNRRFDRQSYLPSSVTFRIHTNSLS